MAYWLAWEEPRAVVDLVHVGKFFARNLGSLIRARRGKPGRFMKARRDGYGPDTASGHRVERTHRRAPSGAFRTTCATAIAGILA